MYEIKTTHKNNNRSNIELWIYVDPNHLDRTKTKQQQKAKPNTDILYEQIMYELVIVMGSKAKKGKKKSKRNRSAHIFSSCRSNDNTFYMF